MDLFEQFKNHVRDDKLFDKNDHILLAVSTGVDSMALWDLCRQLPDALRPKMTVAYVDHHLRAQSTAETNFIKTIATQRQTPLYCAQWALDQHPQEGVEAAARAFRYQFFYDTMLKTDCNLLVTAHHGDDLAETIIMKLSRSGDLKSVVGLQTQRGFHELGLVRPLLPYSKAEIYDYAKSGHLDYFEDVTNQEDTFLRNRLRHHVLPQLKTENPNLLAHTQYFSESLASLLAFQETFMPQLLVQQNIKTTATGIKGSVAAFKTLPSTTRLAFIQGLWGLYFKKVPLKATQAKQILALLMGEKPQVTLDLEGELQFQRVYQSYFIQKNQTLAVSNHQTFQLKLDHWQPLSTDIEVGIFKQAPLAKPSENLVIQPVLLTKMDWPLTVRHRRPGDRYLLANGNHGKLKKLFIDQHVPQSKRQKFWLIFANENLLWIPNFRFFQLFHTSETDKMSFVLCFKQRL
ncbi:tRNA lysidine(34) synthetase TilS [Agrilactobacillus yilanensis]|uniref:tRNA(Ile)-lysidine synthase n=1 Tax=Agrilactobacillus yilanensis TaxID=2485997 RepID=A0ABW4J6I0_9LACO|nr:tRNA lysidine(34) synthetase TilS [Agrilactobacillus yilanensis]